MYQLFFVVAAAVLFCSVASISDADSKEMVQNFEKCTASLPPSLTGEDEQWVTETPSSYVKWMDDIFAKRLTDIYFTGVENRTAPESLCLVENGDAYVVGVLIKDRYTSGSLGIAVTSTSTLQPNGLISSVFHFPNSETPAMTVNWMIVLSDRHTYALLIACIQDGHRGFALLTTEPELDPTSMQKIKTYLENAGFDKNLNGTITYSSIRCSNTP